MFRVVAVDDEPSALSFLCQIVEKRCPGFEIVGRASNGRECLDMLAEARPDAVLSDIKMPVMDGIALAKAMHEAHPEIPLLMISGYQEFEYARSALKYGVYDYLLKPLVPSQLAEVFSRLRGELEQRRLERRNRVLKRLYARETVDAGELEWCFPEKLYNCALVRRNGLPKRFARGVAPEAYEAVGDSISMFGRDEMERVYLCPSGTDIVKLSEDIIRQQEGGRDYCTAVYAAAPFPIEMLPNVMRRLCRALEETTVLGITQLFSIDWTDNTSRSREGEEGEDFKTFEHYLKTGDAPRARREFERLMREWEAARIPQLALERRLRYVLFLCSRMDSARHLKDVGEHLLDDAFYHIVSMAEMRDYMEELIFPEASPDGNDAPRMDSPEQFERIRGYVLANLAEPLSLESLGRRFGISQSYISKMFRKYEDRSFNTFLTETRMERACAILRAQPETLVKDAALMVGYADPFYFSRCFRAYTGMSPRDYAQTGNS
ncbi:MAG: response regulator [Clostridia bacterium]|nr:response regulator [Clostridia bacterium]